MDLATVKDVTDIVANLAQVLVAIALLIGGSRLAQEAALAEARERRKSRRQEKSIKKAFEDHDRCEGTKFTQLIADAERNLKQEERIEEYMNSAFWWLRWERLLAKFRFILVLLRRSKGRS
jgi:hypothetical protein